MTDLLLSLQLALSNVETAYLNNVDNYLRKADNILLANPPSHKLVLGQQVCKQLDSGKSLLQLNLQTYYAITKEPSITRRQRYTQQYTAISTAAILFLCPRHNHFL